MSPLKELFTIMKNKKEKVKVNGEFVKVLAKKVKLNEKMSRKDVNSLLKSKQEELKK